MIEEARWSWKCFSLDQGLCRWRSPLPVEAVGKSCLAMLCVMKCSACLLCVELRKKPRTMHTSCCSDANIVQLAGLLKTSNGERFSKGVTTTHPRPGTSLSAIGAGSSSQVQQLRRRSRGRQKTSPQPGLFCSPLAWGSSSTLSYKRSRIGSCSCVLRIAV